MKDSNCYECTYKGNVPGSAHSSCNYPGVKSGMFDLFSRENIIISAELNIKANPHGVKSGWFIWPIDFDPVWLENCDGFTKKEK